MDLVATVMCISSIQNGLAEQRSLCVAVHRAHSRATPFGEMGLTAPRRPSKSINALPSPSVVSRPAPSPFSTIYIRHHARTSSSDRERLQHRRELCRARRRHSIAQDLAPWLNCRKRIFRLRPCPGARPPPIDGWI